MGFKQLPNESYIDYINALVKAKFGHQTTMLPMI